MKLRIRRNKQQKSKNHLYGKKMHAKRKKEHLKKNK